jgi:hypothetical protein
MKIKMKINCYLSEDCGSESILKTNIATALENEGVEAEVDFYRIDDAKAVSLRISGSPSVFINGKELQPSDAAGFS